MNKKLFYGIGAVIFLILLGTVGYFVYQRTSTGQIGDTASTTSIVNEPIENQGTIVYRNNTYGFSVPLPESWRGYTVREQAQGSYLEVRLMHPQSSEQSPRMDVPVLVVPVAAWNKWYPPNDPQGGQHPFAAPVPATERARNTKYVFATAPRYNFSYLSGWEEVDEIVKKITALNIFPAQVQNLESELVVVSKKPSLNQSGATIKINKVDTQTKTVSITCVPPSKFQKGGYWYVFFGDGTSATNMYEHLTPDQYGGLSVGAMLDSVNIDFKPKQFFHTYKHDGLFNIICVPLAYDPEEKVYKVTAFLEQSPYKATEEIRIGDYVTPGVLKLSVNRTTGKIPLDFNASCYFLGKPKIPVSLIQLHIDERNPTKIDLLDFGGLASIPEKRQDDLGYNFAKVPLPADTKVVYSSASFPENLPNMFLFLNQQEQTAFLALAGFSGPTAKNDFVQSLF